MRKLEVLAPAGSFSHLIEAVNAGADAVYFGAGSFNARQLAVNFTENDITEAVQYCHRRNVKAYGTLNTVVTDRELKAALKTAECFYKAGADALILQDLGLSSLIKQTMPDIRITASTQMAVHSLDGVKMLQKLGFTRVVLARELSFKEIKHICENSEIEIEVFVHGALCMCISGQCYMSSVIGQRSGNRGKCAQPCRLPYSISGKTGYPLSLKDLFYGNKLKELSDIGVTSVKIEGRMKSTNYVSQVTGAYSEAVKSGVFTEKNKEHLSKVFSRGGFTDGYFEHTIGRSMFGRRSEDDKNTSKNYSNYQKFPMKAETEIKIENNYRPVLSAELSIPKQNNKSYLPEFQFKFKTISQIPQELNKDHLIWIEFISAIQNKKEVEKLIKNGYHIGVSLPSFVGDLDYDTFAFELSELKNIGITDMLVSNLGQIKLTERLGFHFHTDMEMNIFNSFSLKELLRLSVSSVMLSPELSFPQIRDMEKPLKTGIIAYGRLPVMTTRACIFKSNFGCEKCSESIELTDRINEKFAAFRDFGCINKIYNSRPLYIGDMNEYKSLGLSFIRLDFTTERKKEVSDVIKLFLEEQSFKTKFTRGLYSRGVQ